MKKRICATFLALCLIMSLLPANALAAELGEEEPQAAACTCDTLCTEGAVNELCPVCMADITACTGEAPQPEAPVCTCETLCAEGAVNELCPVCMADITACTGEAPQPEAPVCTCETLCAEGAVNELCPVCIGDLAACTGTAVTPETPETPEAPVEPAPLADNVIYVSNAGTANGDGSQENPYATLAAAVDAINGKTGTDFIIELQSDLTITTCARITDKNVTIDGNGFTIKRGENFDTISDNARSWYNPAMIEVTVPGGIGARLTLTNIILDDAGKHEGTVFAQAVSGKPEGDKSNLDYVQDAMVAAYGTDVATAKIILGNGAILQDFGGMSAVRIAGNTTLTMETGSKICDENVADREKGPSGSNGPAGAVWVQGGKATMESGAEICDMVGRAFYVDTSGTAEIGGTIYNITADAHMWQGTAGVAVHGRGDSDITLTSTCKIKNFDTKGDSVVGIYGSDLNMQKGSVLSDITGIMAIYMDDMGHDYTHKALVNGLVDNVDNNPVMRSWYGHIEIGPTGVVQNCSASQVLYTNNGSRYTISGKLLNNSGTLFYLANQSGGRVSAVMNEGAVISGTKGVAVRVNNGSQFIMNGGTITNNTTGVQVSGKDDFKGVEFIMNGGTISDNISGISYTVAGQSKVQLNGGTITGNGTNYQISASGGSAQDEYEYLYIAPGILKGNTGVTAAYYTVTLDDDYKAVYLGKASTDSYNALKTSVANQHKDWPVAGSSALWIKPENGTESYHFTISRPSGAKKTSLFAAYLPLQANGLPVSGVEATLVPVENESTIDITLPALPDGASAYALMFVNNKEYTLSPDDITIYTGGGQNDEIYDNGGLPKLTLYNCIDKLKEETSYQQATVVTIDGVEVEGTADEKMETIADLFKVTYLDANGNIISNDETPGEYTAVMTWTDSKPREIIIDGNSVKDTFETGTLIVRHTEDKAEAEEGSNTYLLLQDEPTEKVDNAVAIAKEGFWGSAPTFYINGDTNREITDTTGISILDDSLLLEHENDNRQQLMEKKAADFLGSAGEKKTYAFDFHYLDLVDAYNGNAWVSASNGTTVYLPYPEGTDFTTDFTLVHYKDLHREYGISGQANVEQAIQACELEEITATNTDYGIKFDVDSSGFSPFALVWTVDAHTITATAGPGGSITPSGAVTVADGMDQSFTITADPGYRISDVKVDNISVGAVSSYPFTNVTEDHTITATFAKDSSGSVDPSSDDYTLHYVTNGGKHLSAETKSSAWTKDYEDLPVPERDGYTFVGWYWDLRLTDPVRGDVKVDKTTVDLYAKWEADGAWTGSGDVSDWLDTVNHKAFLSGYPDGTFGTDQNMTRAEVAQMFYSLLLDKDVKITKTFTDVPADAWYAKAVNTLASLGMLGGYPDGTFQPDRTITRAEFAVVALAFTDGGSGASCSFTDVNRSDWFYQYAAQASEYGWIGGYPDGSFRPNNKITRAEVSVIVNNMLERSADTRFIDRNQDKLVSFTDLTSSHWAYHAIMEATNTHTYTNDGSSEVWNTIK